MSSQWNDTLEAELIELARRDPEAFSELYHRYHQRIFAYLLTYASSVEDASDLAQHVFLKAFEALPNYRQRGVPFAAWLFRIARNTATDAYRRKRRVLPWDHLEENVRLLQTRNLEADAVRREELNEMRVLIAKLDHDKQELLALRFASELKVSEVAAVVNRSEASVRKQLQRIIRQLREEFHETEI